MRNCLWVSMALLSLFTVSIASAATFKTASTITVGNTAGGFVVGDFTSDGNLDVAIVNSNNAQVYVGNGRGKLYTGSYHADDP